MEVFFLSFMIFFLAMTGLALGWLFSNRSIKGSCGGLSAIPGMEKNRCACSNPCEKRKQRMAEEAAASHTISLAVSRKGKS